MSDEEPLEPGPDDRSVEEILGELVEMVETARGLPMSTSIRIERSDVLDLLDAAVARLPEELRAARYMLRERDEFLARTRRDAEEIMDDAKSRVAHMVQRTEVVRAADHRAREILEQAEAESRRMRHEAEDYCDQKLASFQVVLERIGRTVAAGRQRLSATVEEIELRAEDEPSPASIDHELE